MYAQSCTASANWAQCVEENYENLKYNEPF
jgi:hypothetical protein